MNFKEGEKECDIMTYGYVVLVAVLEERTSEGQRREGGQDAGLKVGGGKFEIAALSPCCMGIVGGDVNANGSARDIRFCNSLR